MSTTRPLPTEDDLEAIRDGVRAVCAPFGDDYWTSCDTEHRFPWEFYERMAAAGWVGIASPTAYGGGGAGISGAGGGGGGAGILGARHILGFCF